MAAVFSTTRWFSSGRTDWDPRSVEAIMTTSFTRSPGFSGLVSWVLKKVESFQTAARKRCKNWQRAPLRKHQVSISTSDVHSDGFGQLSCNRILGFATWINTRYVRICFGSVYLDSNPTRIWGGGPVKNFLRGGLVKTPVGLQMRPKFFEVLGWSGVIWDVLE